MGTLCGERTCKVKRKRYSRKFQRMAVERMRSSDNIGDLAKELGVTRRCLYKWRTKLDYLEPGEDGPRPNSHESAYRKQSTKKTDYNQHVKRQLANKIREADLGKPTVDLPDSSYEEIRDSWRSNARLFSREGSPPRAPALCQLTPR